MAANAENLGRKRVFLERRHAWSHSQKCDLVEGNVARHCALRIVLLLGASGAVLELERRELEAEGTRS